MKQEAIIEALVEGAEQFGLEAILAEVFAGRGRAVLPLSRAMCEASIDELDLSVRGANAMKRTNAFTIGALVDLVSSGDLIHIRNLGKKTEKEIKTKLLVYCYLALSAREKRAFFLRFLKENAYWA